MKTLHIGIKKKKKKSWVAPYYGWWFSPWKAARMFRALHWDNKVVDFNPTYSLIQKTTIIKGTMTDDKELVQHRSLLVVPCW